MTAPATLHHDDDAALLPLLQVTRATGPTTAHALRLIGELDMATAPTLAADLDGAGELVRGLPVQVDLSELVFLDSAGLTALNNAAAQLERVGATGVTLTRASRPVLLLLTLAADAGWLRPGIDCPQLTTPGRPCGRRSLVTDARSVTSFRQDPSQVVLAPAQRTRANTPDRARPAEHRDWTCDNCADVNRASRRRCTDCGTSRY